jgi:polygalacturonase
MVFNNTGFAFRLKTGAGRGGSIANLTFEDSAMSGCGVGFEYSAFYGGHPQGGYDPTALPMVRGVSTRNVTGDATIVGR